MQQPDPAEFTHVSSYYTGGIGFTSLFMREENAKSKAAMEGKRHPEAHTQTPGIPHKCDHCGALHNWGSVYSSPRGVVAVGHICAEKIFDLPDYVTLLRKRAEKEWADYRIKLAKTIMGLHQLGAFIKANPGAKGWLRDPKDSFAASLRRNVFVWGWNRNQVEAASNACKRWVERQATPVMVNQPKQVAPAGVWEGALTFISKRVDETAWGEVVKSLWEHVDGWRVWMTLPSNGTPPNKGDVCKIKTTLTKSDKDPTFAFGKRPRYV